MIFTKLEPSDVNFCEADAFSVLGIDRPEMALGIVLQDENGERLGYLFKSRQAAEDLALRLQMVMDAIWPQN